ncbi:ISL3 family transposase [Natronosporangium hydrolyticum]|uniref:ISL3 family transposase n=1 Tax=Natronosporangium hydrolyticum TaxID=2811111 RepID=A0A895YNL5_9ACTN|nr:ISL3 family transposase [Natronosporangium hydrolyticum]
MENVAALLPHMAQLRLERIWLKAGRVRIEAATTRGKAECPGCRVTSGRVHSRYQRRLVDSAIGGREVLVTLRVRRFFCDHPDCEKKTFVEQVQGLTSRHGRRTAPVERTVQAVAMALGGRPGARLVEQVAAPVSRSTLLRAIRRTPDPQVATPRVLGVDEFAKRRGHRYATILIDVETGRPVDVLPDREADTFAAWLRDHPGVEVICRDRSGGYAEGAATGAPQAVQVADRWHLMHNLSQAVRKVVTAHRRCLRTAPATPPAEQAPSPPLGEQSGLPPAAKSEGRRASNARARHAAVHELLAQGVALRGISRRLQMNVKTVRKYARAEHPEQLIAPNPPTGRDVLGAFKPYLQTRIEQEPEIGNQLLFAEIRGRGYRGSLRTLREYLAQIRRPVPAVPPAPVVPSARQITGWIMRPDDKLDEDDRLGLKTVCQACPELATLTELAQEFNQLVRTRSGHRLEEWINKATSSAFPEVRGFAKGLYSDFDAVKAGLTLHWSSGKVEGAVTRIKMIKRQMYGRAKLDLLRKRIIAPP